jgi:ABC-type sulfate transport system permease component
MVGLSKQLITIYEMQDPRPKCYHSEEVIATQFTFNCWGIIALSTINMAFVVDNSYHTLQQINHS